MLRQQVACHPDNIPLDIVFTGTSLLPDVRRRLAAGRLEEQGAVGTQKARGKVSCTGGRALCGPGCVCCRMRRGIQAPRTLLSTSSWLLAVADRLAIPITCHAYPCRALAMPATTWQLPQRLMSSLLCWTEGNLGNLSNLAALASLVGAETTLFLRFKKRGCLGALVRPWCMYVLLHGQEECIL